MSTNPETTRMSSDETPNAERALPRLFKAGLVGWGLGTLIVFGLSWVVAKPGTLPLAMLWTLNHWWIAFLVGVVALVAVGVRGKLPLGRGLVAFVLPMLLLVAVAALCLAVYPNRGLREDLMTFLPVVLFFYAVAYLWMSMKRVRESGQQFVQAVFPPLVGGIAVLAGVAVPVFASNEFRYRDTFSLRVIDTRVENGLLVCDGTLAIHQPDAFNFRAPRYVWADEDAVTEDGKIVWGKGGEPSGSAGEYPFQVSWTKGVPSGGVKEIGLYEDMLCFEVRLKGDDKVVYSLCQPLVGE